MFRYFMTTLLILASFSAFAGDLSSAESRLMLSEAKRLWHQRDQRDALEESLSKFELALSGDEKNPELLLFLTRGYYLLGDGHTDNSDEKMKFFDRAKAFGEQGLSLNQDFKKVLDKDGFEKAIKQLKKEEAPILFWTAASLAKWSKANGIFSSLKYKGQIVEMIKRVEALEPDYFYAAVPRYWGGFYAVAPSIAGGDMKKSKKNFEKAMKKAPEYLGTRVLFAELYLVKEGKKKEFKKELEAVLATKDTPSEISQENRIEKKKAEKLLEQMDGLF